MQTSESIGKIAPALLAAQKAITFAVKDAKNPQFKSTYADLSSVIDATKPALNQAGICFIQMPAPSDPGCLALTTRLIHESGEWIESTATCPLQKHDPQGYGSAMTYLKRYSLASAVGLYQDDDDGNAASKPASKPVPIISATKGEMESLPIDVQIYVRDLADEIQQAFRATDAASQGLAVRRVESERLDDSQKMALWTLLDSKTRTAFKKVSQELSKTKEAA